MVLGTRLMEQIAPKEPTWWQLNKLRLDRLTRHAM
jgi:hypothetical protein